MDFENAEDDQGPPPAVLLDRLDGRRLGDRLMWDRQMQSSGSALNQGVAIVASSAGGWVRFDGERVGIDRSGAVSFLIHGMAGRKIILLADIQGVRLRRANGRHRGHIRFVLMGAKGQRRVPAADENSVLFDLKDQPPFLALASAVQAAARHARKHPGRYVGETAEQVHHPVEVATDEDLAIPIQPGESPTATLADDTGSKPVGGASALRKAFRDRWAAGRTEAEVAAPRYRRCP